MQLALIIPFMVLFYNRGPLIGNIVMLIITTFCLWHACYQVEKYQLRAGFFAVENYNLLDKLFSKPWTFLHGVSLGVSMAYLYIQILNYRKELVDSEKIRRFPQVHYLMNSPILSYVSIILGNGLIVFNFLIGHPAIADPYSWTMLENQLYCSVVRVTYNVGCFMIIIPMFLGHFNFGKYLMSTSLMRAIGKLSFLVALILPLAIGLLYNTQ